MPLALERIRLLSTMLPRLSSSFVPCSLKLAYPRRGFTARTMFAEVMRGTSKLKEPRAGGWRSLAFMSYLDEQELEAEAVTEAHLADAESESDDVLVEL